MNRLKFRAWDKENKRYDNNHHIVIALNGDIINQQDGSGNDVYIIEQFTGLKDKNGKKIYEGDICDPVQNYVVEFGKDSVRFPVMPVEYHYGRFILIDKENEQTFPLNEFTTSKIIIGNIHENQDLTEWINSQTI